MMAYNESAQTKKDKILIVDDGLLKLEMTKRAIINQYDVITAISGKEALALLEKETPDLILLDVEMPEMDGYAVIQELQIMEKTKNIPVIFLTAKTDAAAELFGLSLGAVDYITVPFSPPLLLKRLELHLFLVKQKNELRYFNQNLMDLVDERTIEIEKSKEDLRYALEVAEAANRTKTAFLANMSHEIRTPLNSIIGFSELSQDEDNIAKIKGYLANITESAKWLLNIINDILDISVIESDKIVLEHVPFDFTEIFEHCRSLILPKAMEKGIAVDFHTEHFITKKLLGDPVRLRQAIMNLLSNAVKFTNDGKVELAASVKNRDENSITVYFEVKDSGIGMSPEQIEKIYEPFMQADNSVTRKFGGTGLGLTIVKHTIEIMGGTLNVESAVGAGSKFSFELVFDIDNVTSKLPTQEIVINEFERPNFEGEVLICEDNELNQKVINEHLIKVGLNTVMAYDGKEGVEILEKRVKNGEKMFDLIFMDIQMPIMSGLEAVAKIIELGVKTPIVALTANVMPKDIEQYRLSGMSDTVGKPFTTQELWKCLVKYIPVKSYTAIDKQQESAEEEKQQKLLKLNFAKDNQNRYSEIITAASAGDFKTAGRIAHTLKSNAGQIGEKELQGLAAALEAAYSEGENKPDDYLLQSFDAALKAVLARLMPFLDEANEKNKVKITDKAKIQGIIEELEPMLVNKNPDCEDFLDDIYKIPGAEMLAKNIEKFKYKKAVEELTILKKGLEAE